MVDTTRPLLPLPAAETAPFRRPGGGGGKQAKPKKARQVERLEPMFLQLAASVEAKRAELSASPLAVSPEQVVVFETNGPDANDFVKALESTPSLRWLASQALEDVEPDDDFYDKKDATKTLTARLFLVMANHAALGELISLWRTWSGSGRARLPPEHKAWGKAFGCLREIRFWSAKDRLEETGLLEDWQRRKADGFVEEVPVEIELWYRQGVDRQAASHRIRAHVTAVGGAVVDEATIEPIAYHGILASLPLTAVEELLSDDSVALVKSEDVHLLRPVPQQPAWPRADMEETRTAEVVPPQRPSGEPTVALLDGLPLENHAALRGRLIVDDPDGWGDDYPAGARRHGTAMASLLLHGDRSVTNDASVRPLYVRPVLKPRLELPSHPEEAPQDKLWIDVIHRAVLRIVGGGAEPAAAPSVRIINLSLGDAYRPWLRAMSPLARLLDWLSWRYQLLFIVSAGNHHGELEVEDDTDSLEVRTLKALQAAHRHRRLLCPAEAINALTVGALHVDGAGPWRPLNPGERELITTPGLPSPVSALGRGHRRSVKPDLLAPGGRVVFVTQPGAPTRHTPSFNRARQPPGQRVAAPGARGVLDAEEFSFGTSNAAILTSRAAIQIVDVVRARRSTDPAWRLDDVPEALLAKCLLVHTAAWSTEAQAVLEKALRNEHNSRRFRDHLTGYVGFGHLRTERALACEATRATLVGGGALPLENAVRHRVPLPAGLNARVELRHVIVTLAWFSPIKPSEQKYRVAALDAVVTQGATQLGVTNAEADGNAAKRGTVQHMVMRGSGSAANVGINDDLIVTVSATADASPLDVPTVPYALAVTIEIAARTAVPVYDEVAAKVRARIGINPRG